jgi:hypothetical protein
MRNQAYVFLLNPFYGAWNMKLLHIIPPLRVLKLQEAHQLLSDEAAVGLDAVALANVDDELQDGPFFAGAEMTF